MTGPQLPSVLGISFMHESYLLSVVQDVGPEVWPERYTEEDEEVQHRVSQAYADRLKAAVEEDLKQTRAETHPRSLGEAGGPGIEFDFVRILFDGAAAYLVWKAISQDVRAAIEKLRRISGNDVLVNDGSSIVLAVDAIADPNTFADIEVKSVEPMLAPDDDFQIPRGYLVVLTVNGKRTTVTVAANGDVLST